MPTLLTNDNVELRRRLQEATIKCSERCLYQSAKWYVPSSRSAGWRLLVFVLTRGRIKGSGASQFLTTPRPNITSRH